MAADSVFHQGTNYIAALCLELNRSTIVNVPHSLISAYKTVLALGVELDSYSFKGSKLIYDEIWKQILGIDMPKVHDYVKIKDNNYPNRWSVGTVRFMRFFHKWGLHIAIEPMHNKKPYPTAHTFRFEDMSNPKILAPFVDPIHSLDDCKGFYSQICKDCHRECCRKCNISNGICFDCFAKQQYNTKYQILKEYSTFDD